MSLILYKVEDSEFIKTDRVKPDELALVLDEDNKEIYVYKPKKSKVYDEYEAEELYNLILNKFLNPNIFMIKELKDTPQESEKVQKVKNFIRTAQPSIFWFNLGKFFKDLFLFHNLRQNYEIFKNYHHSGVWRRRISNQTNLWKLSLFNTIVSASISIISLLIILFAIRPLFSSPLSGESLQLWLQNLTIYEGLLIFLSILIFLPNLIFIIFPLRFPIKPQKYSTLK